MKRLTIFMCIFSLLLLGASGAIAGQKLKLGIISLIENHPDHVLLRNSFIDGLKGKGYEPEVTLFDANSAQYPETYIQRGVDSAKKMEADGVELIYCTGMYHGLANSVKIPIIDGVFLSPVILNLAHKKDGKMYAKGNATGNIFSYSFKDIVQLARDLKPNAKKIAYLGNPKSPATRPVAEIEKAAEKVGFTVVECQFTTPDGVITAIEKASTEADIAFATNDIALFGMEGKMLSAAADKKFPVIVGIVPLIDAGAVAAIQWDWSAAGLKCADKADKVLKGTQANTLPIEDAGKVDIGINTKILQALKLEIPYSWLEAATKIIE